MSGYAIAQLEEIPELGDGRCPFRPVRHHLGISAFGVNAWTARNAGDRIINEHDEDDPEAAEELYLVLRGRAIFELDGERRDAPAGTFVFVSPGVKRTAFAEEPATTIVAVGGTAGKPYVPLGWEVWAPLRALFESGDYPAVIERARELAETYPQSPILFYNLACAESLSGRTDDALADLRRAIELSELMREYATDDADLDAIRGEPAFAEIVGA